MVSKLSDQELAARQDFIAYLQLKREVDSDFAERVEKLGNSELLDLWEELDTEIERRDDNLNKLQVAHELEQSEGVDLGPEPKKLFLNRTARLFKFLRHNAPDVIIQNGIDSLKHSLEEWDRNHGT